MESPYAQKKFNFTQQMRAKSERYRECVTVAATTPSAMVKQSYDNVHMSSVDYDGIITCADKVFTMGDESICDTDAQPKVVYTVVSNLINGIHGGQLSTEVDVELDNLYDARDTRVYQDSDVGRQEIIVNSHAMQIGMGETEAIEPLVKAFGWNRSDIVNMPATNRNLSALLRQMGCGMNVASRIIKLMCYYLIAEKRGTIKFCVDELNRFNVIGYNYASVGMASVVDDCAFSYCSDPHNGYDYILHAVGMSSFPRNHDHVNNELYDGLVLPADASNLRIVIPDANEVGMPNNVEMTAKIYLCSLNVLMCDYQLGDKLIETLWCIAAGLIAHNAMSSVTIPRVDSLALLARPVWNPILSVANSVRRIDLSYAVMIAYHTRSALWVGVNTLCSWGMKGKHSYDGLLASIIHSTSSKLDRLYIYRTLDQCVGRTWQIVSWLDSLRSMRRLWLEDVSDLPLLWSYWAIDNTNIIDHTSKYDSLRHGVLLRRSEDYTSSNGQRAGCTGIALEILDGDIYTSSTCRVVGNGVNVPMRNRLSEGPITVVLSRIHVIQDRPSIARMMHTRAFDIDLDLEIVDLIQQDEGVVEESDVEEVPFEELTEEAAEQGSSNDVNVEENIEPELDIENLIRRHRFKSGLGAELRKQVELRNQAASIYLKDAANQAGLKITALDVNHPCVKSALMRFFTYGDKNTVDSEVGARVGTFKLFGVNGWRYMGGREDIQRIISCGSNKHGHWTIVRRLIPRLMSDMIFAKIDVFTTNMIPSHWPRKVDTTVKLMRLWNDSANLRKSPDVILVDDAEYERIINDLNNLIKNPDDLTEIKWVLNQMYNNKWFRSVKS